jgi:ribose transport system ATP-binding protein
MPPSSLTTAPADSHANAVSAELRGISKAFPGVQALDDVSVQIRRGEILGIAGENGSGKSTLMKVLAGTYVPDEGEIVLDGERVDLHGPVDAVNRGVTLVAQEVQVQSELTVAENVLFGRMPRRRVGLIDWRATTRAAREVLQSLDLDLDPQARLGDLPLHQEHMVSIAAMLHRRPRVIILDEPTASLPQEYVQSLFVALRAVRARGGSVVYITHRLTEYFELCDRLVVLRDGRRVAERRVEETDEDKLIQLMVGRELSDLFERTERQQAEAGAAAPALKVLGVSTGRKLRDIDLEVRRGEIVGVAGQAGAGRSTLARVLFGTESHDGRIEVDGRPVTMRSPADAIRAGIAYVPDDRKRAGLVLSTSVADNITLPSWSRLSRGGIRGQAAEARVVDKAIADLGIATPSPSTPAMALSGGNQQKVVIAKWLAREPRLLVLDEPTRGVDVGAKDELYRLVESLAAQGLAVLVFSSELLELIRLSDRIVVMRAGRIVGEQPGDGATEESITAMAFTRTEARSEP